MSNFTFLQSEWPEIHESAVRVEGLAKGDPRAACFYARRTLELAVNWMYSYDPALHPPYEDSLSALIHEPTFRSSLPHELFLKMRAIKDLGNLAVHSNRPIRDWDALQAVRELFHVLYWMARTYTRAGAERLQGLEFNPALLPEAAPTLLKQTASQLRTLQDQLAEKDAHIAEQAKGLAETDAEIARLKAEIAGAKQQNQSVPDTHDYSEAQTRDFFIDLMLREAGWPLDRPEDREYPVTGMPTKNGQGRIDYVLWGDDGLPLAIVEAKRSKKDARIGQQQAKLYADCLEKMTGQRPIIFYTNGYETWIWDDVLYPPRPVQGFYKKEELERMIQRRTARKPLAGAAINPSIVERHYQVRAIRHFSENLEQCRRKGLLVMATGAGKTRTVIALVDLLQRCNWVKRVLFLVDRTALVNQAANAFKTHLPDSSPVNLVMEKEETGSRVMLSTYPTMMNLIDQSKGETRRFGVGHFDLVVIDEAHRSVYQKYGAIFEYFDSLLLGLTATPRDEIDRNTYSLFDLQSGMPTDAYELEEAVRDGFLVPPMPVSVPLKFQREGMKYEERSEEEKEQWDALEWDEDGEVPESVDAAAVNKWLFNADTVDKVLEHLMTTGLKVAGGDRLGKTIVFAKNHQHAQFIQERFDKNYPHLKGSFARVIDNYTPYAQSLLDDFSTPGKAPHVAISVDMLDTGIDVPEVVNLVFFKLVRSKTKFFQMIGRGTRLCPELFGPGQPKTFFYVFDYCQNLEFFSQNATGVEGGLQESLTKTLFLHRLELLEGIRTGTPAPPPLVLEKPEAPYAAAGERGGERQVERLEDLDAALADRLHQEVAAMNVDNFIVRPHRRSVEKFRERETWNRLEKEDAAEAAHELAGLPSEIEDEEEPAKRFDLLILRLQLAMLKQEPWFERLRGRVQEIASKLEEKAAIPMVNAQMALLLELQTEEYWQDVTLPMLENVRKRVRDLVKFIDRKSQNIVYSDFEDEIGDGQTIALPGLAADLAEYRRRVRRFLEAHENHPALRRLRQNEPVTAVDLEELERLLYTETELGSREAFEKVFGNQPGLGPFLRGLVGLDREAAKQAFGEFLNETAFNTNQIRFVNQVIDYLTQNGVMDPNRLYEPPFTDLNPIGLDGLFSDMHAGQIVRILETVNQNAGLWAAR